AAVEVRHGGRFFNTLLIFTGLILFALTTRAIISSADSFDRGNLLQAFLFSLWMPILILPAIYALGLWSSYGQALRVLAWRQDRTIVTFRQFLAVGAVLNFDVRAVRELNQYPGETQGLLDARSIRDAIDSVRNHERQRHRRAEGKRIAAMRLKWYAGNPG